MGYQVYWENGRWQGYGVPAYCDYPGCKKEIDRGMGYQHEEDKDSSTPSVFCCSDHQYEKLKSFDIESKETPEWLKHVLFDESWDQWRDEDPETVKKYREMLEKIDV